MSGQPELGITLAEPSDLRRRIAQRLIEIATDHGHDKYSLVDTDVAADALASLFQGELARLNAIATAAQYFESPKDCDGNDCNHDDGACERLQVRYATADDAIEAGSVPLLKQEVDTLSRGAASAFCLEQAAAELVGMPISTPTSELTAAVTRLNRDRNTSYADEDALLAAGRGIAGLFNRDPEDHQVVGVLHEIAGELIAWRADSTRVPDGWQSLVRKGWSVSAPSLARLRPTIVCLCGSMQFEEEMREVAREESLFGHMVLMPLCNMKQPHPLWADEATAEAIKANLDSLHKAKIDAADEVVIVAPGGYIGDSTRSEIEYATAQGKPVRYWPTLSAELLP